MRPPILYLTVAFGAGLFTVLAGMDLRVTVWCVLAGVLVARRVRELDAIPRGRGALRDRIRARSRRLFGKRAPLVDALVIARRTDLDADLRERYARSGLAHLLSISGLHVAFFAAWLNVLLKRLRLGTRAQFVAGTAVMLVYVWLLGFPMPATPSPAMLALLDIAQLR